MQTYVITDGEKFLAFVNGNELPMFTIEGNCNSRGNPYLVFGKQIAEELGTRWENLNITVAHVTSGSLE